MNRASYDPWAEHRVPHRAVPVTGSLCLDLRGAGAGTVRRLMHEAVSAPAGVLVTVHVDRRTALDRDAAWYLMDEGGHLARIHVQSDDVDLTGLWVHTLTTATRGGAAA